MEAALPAGNRRSTRVLNSTRSVGGSAPTATASVDGGVVGPKASNLDRPADTYTATPQHQSRYDLTVVPARPNGMLLDQVGVDFIALENSLAELERQMRVERETLPEAVVELRKEISRFRAKLEAADHLRVMGYCKELPPPEDCRRLQFRRRSHEEQRRVKESFFHMGLAPLPVELSQALRTASFDCSPLSDAQILALLEFMFVDFGLPEAFNFERTTLRSFLYEVYKNYNEVPFHNFRHGFCVTQMMYAIAHCVDLPSKIGDLETLILLTSSICHDLDHPGYNNIYQINARTELALRYNDISPLENHHCSVAFRILDLPECNILSNLSPPVYRVFREGVIRCILATDMARHNEILDQFRDIVPEFDFSNKAHTDLLTMVLIKVADISNEARPMHVAEPWLDKLLTEFFRQSDAEKMEGLPVTPFMDRDKITKPSSQCSFIGLVLLPLFEALGALLPELQELIITPVREALEYYRRLNEACREERIHRKSVVDLGDTPTPSDSNTSDDKTMVKSSSGHSVKSRRSFQVRSRSRSAEEETPESQEMAGLCEEAVVEDEEEEEETDSEVETATEVEVSEKTLKFKISTESGRKSYPGSRKGSRDKNQLSTEFQHHEFARAVREHHERNEHRGSVATSPLSGRSVEFSRCNGDREKCLSFEEDAVSRSSDRRFSENSAYTSGSNTSKRGSSGALMLSSSRTPAVSEDPREAEADDIGASASVPSIQPPCPVPPPTQGTPSHGTAVQGPPTQSTPKQRSPSSFLKKLKTLTERLSFSVSMDKDTSNEGRSQRGSPSPHNHGYLKTMPSPHSSHGSTCEASEDALAHLTPDSGCHERATTLPKTKKHQGHASGRRSWKTILGSGGRGRRSSSSSLEALSPVESPGVDDEVSRDRESLFTSPKQDPRNMKQRGTRTRYLSGSGSGSGDVDVSLTGSFESILQKNDSSGNNNNRKKTSSNFWSSPGNRRGGFLTRLSTSNKQSMDSITGGDAGLSDPSTASHSPGSKTPTTSGRQSGLIASLAASFRGRRSGNQSKTVSPSICTPSPGVQDGVK